MANTKAVYARIDSKLKEDAEKILEQVGLTPSAAISMFYKQITMRKGLPFEVRVAYEPPVDFNKLSEEEIAKEIQKGLDDVKNGKVSSLEKVDAELFEEYGI